MSAVCSAVGGGGGGEVRAAPKVWNQISIVQQEGISIQAQAVYFPPHVFPPPCINPPSPIFLAFSPLPPPPAPHGSTIPHYVERTCDPPQAHLLPHFAQPIGAPQWQQVGGNAVPHYLKLCENK